MYGELLAILGILSFVVSNAIFRKIETNVTPSQINAFRTTIGAITFLGFIILFGNFKILFEVPMQLIGLLLISIVFGQVVGDTAYFETQKQLGTTIAITISMTFPVFTIIFSFLFLKAPIQPFFFLSFFLIAMGVIIIQRSQSQGSNSDEQAYNENQISNKTLFAIVFGFIASISWALGIVFTESALTEIALLPNLEGFSTLIANAIRFPFAAIILIFMALNSRNQSLDYEQSWSTYTWKWLFLGAIIGTSIGALFYAEAIRLAGAAFVSIIWTASPLFALPITWLLNKETINLKGFTGVLITIAGVILILL